MPGRLGSPSGPTTWLCRQRLDEDRMKAGKSRRIRARRARPDPEVRSSRPKSPQRSAVRRRASGSPFASQADAGSETTHLRLTALHAPHCFERGATEHTTRARRESDCACVNGRGCLIIESEPAHRKCLHHVIPDASLWTRTRNPYGRNSGRDREDGFRVRSRRRSRPGMTVDVMTRADRQTFGVVPAQVGTHRTSW
jgi:hypothetical protein